MAPDSSTTLRSSIQPHPSSICSCTILPPLVVNDAVDTTPHHLAATTPSPLVELLGAHHPQHLSPEQQFLPRRRLHGGYELRRAGRRSRPIQTEFWTFVREGFEGG
ncbi:hypothetical protein VPH35_135860 [Triticum aestivum]|uniref:Uncharacterized protein n=1 Tax=Aegilops tauschii subsp. strangulata TaxID=200361 RepID=A0A453R0D9_AEGTS